MWDFARGATPERHSEQRVPVELRRDFEISYTVPSQCAESLAAGRADIGIIPAITYATIPALVILPDAAIAAKGAVRSILLVSKMPIEQVTTIATDTSSRSSVALLQILCQKFWGAGQTFHAMEPDLDSMLRACDAGLLIGDPALRIRGSWHGHHVYDLAAEWRRFTGKPFVFAFWAARLQALGEAPPELDVAAVFRRSRDHGLEPQHVAQIAHEWTTRAGIGPREITAYLTENIHYRLDPENLEGLQLFYRYAAQCGIIQEPPSLRFFGMTACEFVA
jgi:chorismate dehydratase